jgi:hypothetical protein
LSKKDGSRKRTAEDTVSERDIRPLPSRIGVPATENVATANPRPLKRQRDNGWETGRYPYTEDVASQRLYTIPQESLDGDDFEDAPLYPDNRGTHAHASDDMTSAEFRPPSQYFPHRQPDYIASRRARSRAPPSFHELLAQRGRPPPSARSLNQGPYLPGQSFTHRHPYSQHGPSHRYLPSQPGPSCPVPSHVGEPVPPRAFYRTKQFHQEVGDEMDWM